MIQDKVILAYLVGFIMTCVLIIGLYFFKLKGKD